MVRNVTIVIYNCKLSFISAPFEVFTNVINKKYNNENRIEKIGDEHE